MLLRWGSIAKAPGEESADEEGPPIFDQRKTRITRASFWGLGFRVNYTNF